MQPARNEAYGPMIYIASTYSSTSSLSVNVYSNCDSVKLYQNGTLVSEITRADALRTVPNIAAKGGSPIFVFRLDHFQAGELKAEAVLDGKVVCTHSVKTPESATHFEIEIRERGITPVADGSDLIPVYIKAVDDNGTVVPDYDGTVTIAVSGAGTLVGAGIPRIKVEEQTLEGGIGFAFVRTTDVAGEITVTTVANGMRQSSATTKSVAYTGTFVPKGEHTAWVGGVEKFESESVVSDNLAAHKTVTASSQQDDNSNTNFASCAVDDDLSTRWCAMGGSLPQWLEIDLEQYSAISGFEIVWENASLVYQYVIEVSNDGVNWITAVDQSARNTRNGAEEKQSADVTARYVRLTVTGISSTAGWASLYELRIIPQADAEELEPGTVIADSVIERLTASSECVAYRGTDKLRDGVTTIGTGWLSQSKEFPQTVTVEFNTPQTLVGSRIYWEKDSSWYTYSIEVSSDGEQWITASDIKTVGGQHYKPETFEAVHENVRYVRLTIDEIVAGGDYQVGMAEWILYAPK